MMEELYTIDTSSTYNDITLTSHIILTFQLTIVLPVYSSQ